MMEGPGNKPGKMESIKESEEIRKEEVTDESVVEEKTEETASLEVERNKEKETPREQGGRAGGPAIVAADGAVIGVKKILLLNSLF
ncbi:unnamed protein product [Lasius platythorax]|uniref:Uncharacterized protein n=1 Tax=Lasius platythorax TaxID=488582 RepID=A0AAV2MYP9_9HYME